MFISLFNKQVTSIEKLKYNSDNAGVVNGMFMPHSKKLTSTTKL